MLEVRHDLLLERHGDAEALDGDLAHQLEQVGELVGLEREVDGVDGLAAEGGVHHEGRERAADGIAGDAVDLGGGVDLIDAVGLDEGAGGDLAGAGLFAGGGGGEGEGAAGADAEHARDDAGVAHADADDVGCDRSIALEEAHHGDVVGEGLGGGDDLDEVGLEGLDAGEDAVEILGGLLEVVVADDEGGAGLAQLLQLGLLQLASADSSSRSTMWKPRSAALVRTLDLGSDGAVELAAIVAAAAGGDGGGGGVLAEELLELGQGERGLIQVVEAELEEIGLFYGSACALDHFADGRADDRDTHLADPGADKLRVGA